jgi:hypothetical protein
LSRALMLIFRVSIACAATNANGRKNSYGALIGCSLTSKPCFAASKVIHHKEERADSHLFITVLAYQWVQLIRRRLKESDIDFNSSWRTLHEIMSTQCRVTASFRRADGKALHIRKATRAEPEQMAIYRALKVNPAPGGISKTIV